jgi:membrane-bound lytic murein transglycosylase A
MEGVMFVTTNMLKLIVMIMLGWVMVFLWVGPVSADGEYCQSVEIMGPVLGHDDLRGAGLKQAVNASIRFLQRQPAARTYRLCEREYTASELAEDLQEFLGLLNKELGAVAFERQLQDRFELCGAAGPEGDGKVLVTGYFEPLLEGSLERREPFIYPLYRAPDDLVRQDGKVGRMDQGRLVPYWSRATIEDGKILAGNELVFLDDPVEAFILHVQGSGRIRLRDGTIRRIQFAAKNGLPYRSIGRLLVDRGKMELARVSLPAIIDYLAEHPDERREILQYNESFIFFRWGDDLATGPLGRLEEPLTAGRSVALDHRCFPPGILGLLNSRKPIFGQTDEIIGWAPLQRFVVNQDSGSAIRGGGRVDLFLGSGTRARITAGIMKHPGYLYFLVKKK